MTVKTLNLINQFDDVTVSEGTWSQICGKHVSEMSIPDRMLDEAGSGICGVKGCSHESDYYIDFN